VVGATTPTARHGGIGSVPPDCWTGWPSRADGAAAARARRRRGAAGGNISASPCRASWAAISSPVSTPAAIERMVAYPWPGNVRELKNVVERAVYRAEPPGPADRTGAVRSVRIAVAGGGQRAGAGAGRLRSAGGRTAALHQARLPAPGGRYERTLLTDCLTEHRFNRRRAAAALGLTYDQLRGYLRKHRLLEEEKGLDRKIVFLRLEIAFIRRQEAGHPDHGRARPCSSLRDFVSNLRASSEHRAGPGAPRMPGAPPPKAPKRKSGGRNRGAGSANGRRWRRSGSGILGA